MTIATHPFEQRGLGKAPFRYVGIEAQEIAYGERVIGSVGGFAPWRVFGVILVPKTLRFSPTCQWKSCSPTIRSNGLQPIRNLLV